MTVQELTIPADGNLDIDIPAANAGVIIRFRDTNIRNSVVGKFRPNPLTGAGDFYSADLARAPSGFLVDASASALFPEGGTCQLTNSDADNAIEICVTIL